MSKLDNVSVCVKKTSKQVIKVIVQAKMENSAIIYSISCCSKPVRFSFVRNFHKSRNCAMLFYAITLKSTSCFQASKQEENHHKSSPYNALFENRLKCNHLESDLRTRSIMKELFWSVWTKKMQIKRMIHSQWMTSFCWICEMIHSWIRMI